jgi:hypothetical protein
MAVARVVCDWDQVETCERAADHGGSLLQGVDLERALRRVLAEIPPERLGGLEITVWLPARADDSREGLTVVDLRRSGAGSGWSTSWDGATEVGESTVEESTAQEPFDLHEPGPHTTPAEGRLAVHDNFLPGGAEALRDDLAEIVAPPHATRGDPARWARDPQSDYSELPLRPLTPGTELATLSRRFPMPDGHELEVRVELICEAPPEPPREPPPGPVEP